MASGIGGYWTRMVTGLVMGASVVLNILLGEGRGKKLTETLSNSMFVKGLKKGEVKEPHPTRLE